VPCNPCGGSLFGNVGAKVTHALRELRSAQITLFAGCQQGISLVPSAMCWRQRRIAVFPHMGPKREEMMADPVYKIVDVVGTSQQSISNAIGNAISKASGTLRNLGWFEVEQIRGDIRDGKVNRYQVTLKVGFTLE
jgi:dodecin